MLKDMAQNFGAVKIEHCESEPGRYSVGIRVDGTDDGFANIGVGLSLETAIEVAHSLQHAATSEPQWCGCGDRLGRDKDDLSTGKCWICRSA
jgi:hypothetical protein